MKWNKILSFGAALGLVITCFYPWVIIEGRDIIVSGIASTGTKFGKPGYLHFFLVFFYLLFLVINKTWSKKIMIFIAAINVAWAARNFIIISMCHAGECPDKQFALYLIPFFSLAMLVVPLLSQDK